MERRKNVYISFVLYVIALLLALVAPESISTTIFAKLGLYLVLILVLVGIFFGFRSIKEKESPWAGHLMIVIGGLILISPLILYVLASSGFLYGFFQ